ncbi:hypothetical protein EDI_049870 [Entamoeba dispar SAW760]|uniref:RRM domain-containing protein n=1 Tax=Entamoeba dispar (strain ATCC PRA-260 / SAW760) TaxID=370354 RepID=B0EK01_ENTDS|nr:uncharacterized protein EDI_049870 [Entamoeba dispar SAW760]EDR25128.1 hypothetical protein EDI_049870 [Entamoeba dispar SAW760]|eukprot:EDR25128.1 hypothetical protein EDI_049870 [Entamoeba dispar SAW760]
MIEPTLIIGTFNYYVKDTEIKDIISKLVEVISVDIKTDVSSGKSLGVAVVTLKNKSDCDGFIKALSESPVEDLVGDKDKLCSEKILAQPWTTKTELQFIYENGQFSHTSSKEYYANELKKGESNRRGDENERKRSRSRHSRSHSRHFKGSKRHHSRSRSRRERHRSRSRSPRRDKDRDRSKRDSHRH